MNILAIDQGTSGTKAIVVAPDGAVLGESTVAVAPVWGAGGAVEQDPQRLLDSVLAAGRGALVDADAPVGAVGIANQGETVLRWDPRRAARSGRRSVGRTAAPSRSRASSPRTPSGWRP